MTSIILAMKPIQGTYVQNVIAYGTGALNIEETRLITNDDLSGRKFRRRRLPGDTRTGSVLGMFNTEAKLKPKKPQAVGRWTTNILLQNQANITDVFPVTRQRDNPMKQQNGRWLGTQDTADTNQAPLESASRYFKQFKG